MQQTIGKSNSFSFSFHPKKNGHDADYAKGYWIRHVRNLSELAEIIAKSCWVGCYFKDGHKVNANFEFSDFCVFDFDSGEFTIEKALRYFARYAHVIGTTKSHQIKKGEQPPCDRFRVVIPWQERVTSLDTYQFNTRRIGAPLGADPLAFRVAQYFRPCREVLSIRDEGERLVALKPPPPKVYRPSAYAGRRQVPPKINTLLTFGVPTGGRHKAIYLIACDLAQCGFTENETVDLIMDSPLKEAENDAGRTARDGWRFGAAKNKPDQSD